MAHAERHEYTLHDGTVLSLTETQIEYLAAYRGCGRKGMAAEAVGINVSTHSRWMQDDKDYPKAFREAQSDALTMLEDEAFRRAVEGVKQYKFDKHGQPVLFPGKTIDDPDPYYYEHKFSDRLLETLLKANFPAKYKDRVSQEITGTNGQPVEVQQALRRVAISNPDLSEQLCQSLEHATTEFPSSGSDGDTSGTGVDD